MGKALQIRPGALESFVAFEVPIAKGNDLEWPRRMPGLQFHHDRRVATRLTRR
jgi:hypothetical protein